MAKVRSYCFKAIYRQHRATHFDDCVQYVMLEMFERRVKSGIDTYEANIKWAILNYFRANGLSRKSKQSSITINYANNYESNNDLVFAIDSVGNEDRRPGNSVLIWLIENLNLKEETALWAEKHLVSTKMISQSFKKSRPAQKEMI